MCHSRRDLGLHGIEIEGCALLHGRILDGGHGELRHFLLHKHEAPELVDEPIHKVVTSPVPVRARKAHFLEGIHAQVGDKRHVWMVLGAEPTAGLHDELVFVVAEPHGSEVILREVEDFIASRWTLAGNEVQLVIAIQMHFVGPVAELFAFQEVFLDVGVARGGDESREPIEARR